MHDHSTRLARLELVVATRDHGSLGYLMEWRSLTEEQKGLGSVSSFKHGDFVSDCGFCSYNSVRTDALSCQRITLVDIATFFVRILK